MGELDNGLGLEAFIKGSASTEDATASSQESAKAAGDESTQDKTPSADTKTAATDTAKKEDSKKESSPSDTETQVRSTVEEALRGDKGEKKEAKETPADGKEKTDAAAGKEEQAKTSNWDSDENPFKQELTRTQQQLQAARSWSNEVNKQNLSLKRDMQRLEKKIDGTWTEADEKALADQEKAAGQQESISQEEMTQIAELKGATIASLHMAYDHHGKEKVDAEIREFDRLFQNNPLMMHRVTSSRRPIQEALKVLNEYRTAQKYGTGDLTELISKIREEAKAELRPQLIEEVTKEIMGKLDLKNKETGGLRNLRGSGRESVTEKLSEDAKNEHKPLRELFTAG
jgi:hypothetical protein